MRYHCGGMVRTLVLMGATLQHEPQTIAADVELIARGSLSGEDLDLSGLTDSLAPGVPHNRLGGFSAVDYWGEGTRYYALSDRGPQDGAVPYQCRFHILSIEFPQQSVRNRQPIGELEIKLLETRRLQTADGHPLSGDSSAIGGAGSVKALHFDPEGFRAAANGHLFISDEYGPTVREFDRGGRQLRDLPVPRRFSVLHPSGSKEKEFQRNASGRQPNGGMEGLALTLSGSKLFGIMQRPLIQDSTPTAEGKRQGLFNRILEIELATGRTKEWIYPLDDPQNGVSEILAVNDHRFLVIERDGEKGAKAKYKKIIVADLQHATDVSDLDNLPPETLPENRIPALKSVLIDLLDPRFGLKGETFPEKVEGLTFGPRLPNGQLLLIVGIDNDFISTQPSLFLAFRIDPRRLVE